MSRAGTWLLPAAPFAEWLKRQEDRVGSRDALAVHVGLHKDTIRRIINDQDYVEFDTVDRVLVQYGEYLPQDIYPSYSEPMFSEAVA